MQALTIVRCPPVSQGGFCFFSSAPVAFAHALYEKGASDFWAFPVGTKLIGEDHALFQIVRNDCFPDETGRLSQGFWAKALCSISEMQNVQLTIYKNNLSLAWVTLSDKGSAGLRNDTSGPLIEEMFRSTGNFSYAEGFLLPDEKLVLKELFMNLAIRQQFDVICTTGGTGVGPRDITPEATQEIVEMRLRGFEQAMMAVSLAKTPHAMISRAVVGTLGNSLVINLPGSRKAVAENLEAVLTAIPHAVAKLQGDTEDCGR